MRGCQVHVCVWLRCEHVGSPRVRTSVARSLSCVVEMSQVQLKVLALSGKFLSKQEGLLESRERKATKFGSHALAHLSLGLGLS